MCHDRRSERCRVQVCMCACVLQAESTLVRSTIRRVRQAWSMRSATSLRVRFRAAAASAGSVSHACTRR